MVRRPTTAAATAPCLETKFPGQCQCCPPGTPGLPQRPPYRCSLPGRHWGLSVPGFWSSCSTGPPHPPAHCRQRAAIATGPERFLILHLKDNPLSLHQCKFNFITGDAEGTILGIDFLRKFHKTVDPAAAYVQHGAGAIFLGILCLSLNNPVFTALPADIQQPSLMSAPQRSPCRCRR